MEVNIIFIINWLKLFIQHIESYVPGTFLLYKNEMNLSLLNYRYRHINQIYSYIKKIDKLHFFLFIKIYWYFMQTEFEVCKYKKMYTSYINRLGNQGNILLNWATNWSIMHITSLDTHRINFYSMLSTYLRHWSILLCVNIVFVIINNLLILFYSTAMEGT